MRLCTPARLLDHSFSPGLNHGEGHWHADSIDPEKGESHVLAGSAESRHRERGVQRMMALRREHAR